MRLAHAQRLTVFTAFALAHVACVETDPDSDHLSFRTSSGRSATLPASSGGGMWINNGLDDPDVSGIDPSFSLASEHGLSSTHGLLLDPTRHDTVEYLVECALPAGEVITKQVGTERLEFEGAIGLAPEWADEPCDEDCQEWVSACLLARTNVSGQTVSVWMRADHPAIGEGGHFLYPTYEASFFGNLFEDPRSEHYCQGMVLGPLLGQLEGRTCAGLLGASCGFTEYTGCQHHKRCTFSKLDVLGLPTGDSPKDCIVGSIAGADTHHTISTYVGPF